MAKLKRAAPYPPGVANADEQRELIVLMHSDSGIIATPDAVVSKTGKKVSSLNRLLKTHGATITPLFGSENRMAVSKSGQKAPSMEAVAGLAGYYKVEVSGNMDKLCNALLKDNAVASAFIKPAAEPPVMQDEHNAAPSGETPAVTPSFIARQLYLDVAPGGIDAKFAWTLPGGKGDGVRIIDVEGAWRFSHEDLIANQGGVIAGTQSTDIGWRNHGTAVVGEFGGDENSFGITGICPNANVRAIPIFGAGMSSANAIRRAADALNAGDIILIELHRPGPQFAFAGRADQRGYIAIEWWPDDFAAIRYAISRGVIVVEAGGNGAENLDAAIYNTRPAGFPASWTNPFKMTNPQSGAIIVGAGAPPPGTHGRNHGTDRSRLDFSNWGARIDVQGWGREVTTCGYGDLQGGLNEDFWYTDTFSGTSSASPIIVGTLGCIQGRLRARSKPLLTPATATTLLRTTGSPQQDTPGRPASQRIGNRPNLRSAFDHLGVGSKIAIKDSKDGHKELKDGHKDIKEGKEIIKDGHKDIKEKDIKELKDGHKDIKEKDFKEFKELKEKELKEGHKDIKEKDFKEFKEGKEIRETIDVIRPTDTGDTGNTENRLANLENAVSMLTHFISGDIRPDLQGALFNNAGGDVYKNASDSKQEKDYKDTSEV